MPEGSPLPDRNGETILLVDDNADLVEIMKSRLEYLGYRVFVAHDGDAALKIANKVRPHLIVLDLEMPKKDGLEFFKDIRTRYGHAKFPVLVVSGHNQYKETFEEIGASGFLSKPFEIEEMRRQIERILKATAKPNIYLMDIKSNPRTLEIVKALEEESYRTEVVEDLPALEVAILMNTPSAVLMEYMRPNMSGEECIRETKKILLTAKTEGSPIPLVIYSYSGLDYRDKSLKAGADKYIGKPDRYTAFSAVLKELEHTRKP